jgi:hypothetical protein
MSLLQVSGRPKYREFGLHSRIALSNINENVFASTPQCSTLTHYLELEAKKNDQRPAAAFVLRQRKQ